MRKFIFLPVSENNFHAEVKLKKKASFFVLEKQVVLKVFALLYCWILLFLKAGAVSAWYCLILFDMSLHELFVF